MQDGAGGGAALLPRVAVGARDDVSGGGVQIGGVVDDHGVLAAHLRYHALDPALVLYLTSSELVYPQPVFIEPVKEMKRVRGSLTR